MKRRKRIYVVTLIICTYMLTGVLTGCEAKENKSVEVDNPEVESVYSRDNNSDVKIEYITSSSESDNTENKETFNESTEEVSEKMSIVMVGDVLLHTPVTDSGLTENGDYNYEHLFKNVKTDIEQADLAIVNQEVILGGHELGLSGYPAFNGPYEVGDAIARAGFDVVLHGTNHALDKGKNGVVNCRSFWSDNYPEIGVAGINISQEQQDDILIYEKNGIKAAILNYTYGTNGIPMPSDMPYAVNLLDKEKVAEDVMRAKEQADFIIVCPHWGTEYTLEETSEQTEWAEYFAELGVDLVIGTHPHVIEPIKWVEAFNGHKTLVYYSIGNFINATSEYGRGVADRMIGGMAVVNIRKDGSGNIVIDDYGVVPLVTQMLSGRGRITTYKLSDYSRELAAENEILERDSAFSYDYCVELCNRIFGDAVK